MFMYKSAQVKMDIWKSEKVISSPNKVTFINALKKTCGSDYCLTALFVSSLLCGNNCLCAVGAGLMAGHCVRLLLVCCLVWCWVSWYRGQWSVCIPMLVDGKLCYRVWSTLSWELRPAASLTWSLMSVYPCK